MKTTTYPKHRFLEAKDCKIHYLDKGEGAPVICIHGLPGFLTDFSSQNTNGFRLIAFDRPGYGLSERYPSHKDHLYRQIDNILELARKLDIDKPVVAGHSWGALLALCIALKYPDFLKGLILMGPLVFPRTLTSSPTNGLVAAMNLPLLGGGLTRLLIQIAGKKEIMKTLVKGFYPEKVPEIYLKTQMPLILRTVTFRSLMEDKFDFEYQVHDISKHYNEVSVKTHIICGEEDQATEMALHAEPLDRLLPDSTIFRLPGAGHQFLKDDPDLLSRHLDDFN